MTRVRNEVMPQLLPIQEDGELPFYVRSISLSASPDSLLCNGRKRLFRWRFSRILSIILVLTMCGFIYVQFFAFPSQLIKDSRRNININLKESVHQPQNEPDIVKGDNGDSKPVISAPDQLKFEGPTNDRQRAVRDAFVHAWNGYKRYAWGHDHLRPISMTFTEWMECGLTIVDSMDTIIIMGLNEQYQEAREWVEKELSFEKNRFVNLFETTIRVLGGLLSAFHLTGDNLFLERSKDIGERLIGALENSPSAVPYSDVNLKTKGGKQPGWNGDSSLSEVTSIQLEFRELSRLIKDDRYEKAAFKISEHIHSIGCDNHDGLCDMFLSPKTGMFTTGSTITFGARADSYYEYLLKQWLQTGKTIDWLIEDYKKTVDSMKRLLWRFSEPNKYYFIGELLGGKNYSPKMDHLVCFMAGTLALGTQFGMPAEHLEMAKNLSETCHLFYTTPTGLAPEIAYYNMLPGLKEDMNIKPMDAHCLLRPEAFEAWFYMYRVTGEKKYQEWGWDAFRAIEKHAKVENGYSSVNNVKRTPVSYRDMMESFFLSESLKYLYLLLADDQNIIPLHKYVFNTEGHPLPIYND